MSRLALTLALAAALPLAACGDVGDAPAAEISAAPDAPAADVATAPAGTPVPIDTAQSRIEWRAAKVTRAHDGGFRVFRGVVYLDGDRVTGADVMAEAASIYSDTERLTEHLRSPDFFDVATNPEVRVVIDALAPLAAGDSAGASAGATHRAEGTLTMAGRTNRLAFPVALRVEGGAVTADADFTIDRQEWGLTYPGQPDDLIRDAVRLRLRVVAPGPAEAVEAPATP